MYVYQITNIVNNKKYVGITSNYKQRWKYHKRNRVETSKEYDKVLYRAFRKYGLESFVFKLLHDNLSIEEAKQKEINLIKELDTLSHSQGYNVTEGGDCNGQHGERNRNSKLTEIQALDIITRRELGETRSTVYADYSSLLKISGMESIWLGTSWKHIQPKVVTKLHGGRVLTDTQVREIHILITENNLTYRKIAEQFKVSAALITNIKKGNSYSSAL